MRRWLLGCQQRLYRRVHLQMHEQVANRCKGGSVICGRSSRCSCLWRLAGVRVYPLAAAEVGLCIEGCAFVQPALNLMLEGIEVFG